MTGGIWFQILKTGMFCSKSSNTSPLDLKVMNTCRYHSKSWNESGFCIRKECCQVRKECRACLITNCLWFSSQICNEYYHDSQIISSNNDPVSMLLRYMLCRWGLTVLDRESTHLLQLHTVKQSCCTAANPGATGRLHLLATPTTYDLQHMSCLIKGVTNLLHLCLQLYNSGTSWYEAAMGGLIPYPIQERPFS